MRRFLVSLILALILAHGYPSCSTLHAAVGACVNTSHEMLAIHDLPGKAKVVITCTGGTAGEAGQIADFTINPLLYTKIHPTFGIRGWYLYSVETNPGTTNPTAAYDIAIWNTDKSFDLAQNTLINRSATNTEKIYLGSVGYPVIDSNWILSVTNNIVASATVVITLIFVPN